MWARAKNEPPLWSPSAFPLSLRRTHPVTWQSQLHGCALVASFIGLRALPGDVEKSEGICMVTATTLITKTTSLIAAGDRAPNPLELVDAGRATTP